MDGIHFIKNDPDQWWGIRDLSDSPSNVITRCKINYYNYGLIVKASGSNGWYIADNTIVGDKTNPLIMDLKGEGIYVENTSEHTICHNSITLTADGISCHRVRCCDIFNNDIYNVSDDGIEPDWSYANILVRQNRITNPLSAGFSFQPMFSGPWYFIRNQVMGTSSFIFKYRVVDRFLVAHNTFVSKKKSMGI